MADTSPQQVWEQAVLSLETKIMNGMFKLTAQRRWRSVMTHIALYRVLGSNSTAADMMERMLSNDNQKELLALYRALKIKVAATTEKMSGEENQKGLLAIITLTNVELRDHG